MNTDYDWDNTYTDQEGVVWDWKYAKCPRCRKTAKPSHRHFTTMTSFRCPACDLLYDEPHWEPAESAFVTCISGEDAADDPDPEVRRRYREYHGDIEPDDEPMGEYRWRKGFSGN